ncbi:MAG: 4Fe-4S dicluster domain-containing protein [Candidatus Thorarchaeota archaeon]
MCKWCMKHGAGKKWYLNSKNYMAKEIGEEDYYRDYLTEQWMNFEQVFIRKIKGFSSIGLGYKLKMPIIGKILRSTAEKMIHSEKQHRKAVRADGHFGQVIPLEDAKIIMSELAAEPIIANYCMCRWMQRGDKERCCINFGVLSEVIEKLPRFIPKERTARVSREEAINLLEENNEKGYIQSAWFQPVPYVNAICSCESPECGGLRLRNDFDLKAVYKSEYIIRLDQDKCEGCKQCVSRCQFSAIRFIPSQNRVIIDYNKCFGCGNCRDACKFDALNLIPREEYPGFTGEY